MRKITLLFFIATLSSLSALAQYNFTPIAGPTAVAEGAAVTINMNDIANGVGVPADTYVDFVITVDWISTNNAWVSEADLTVTTTAGSIVIDPPTTGSADSGAATTVTFEGAFPGPYDPSVDGFLDIVLNQSWNASTADWSNIRVEISPAPACPDPMALIANNFTVPNFADISWTASAGATGYNWEIQPQGVAQGTAGTIDSGTTATTNDTATNLVDTTDYTLYVQSDCGGALGNWISLDFSYNFPPTNDECVNAIGLTVNTDYSCGTVEAGTTLASTASAQADDVTGTPNTDVWYSFVATGTDHRVSLTNVVNQGGGTSTSTDMGMGVYDATGGCASLVFFDDSDPNTLDLTGLVPATTYYVRVYGWSSTIQNNNFDICIGTPPAPPANDDCANAAGVVALPYNFVQDASGATNNAGFISDCGGMNDGVWYTFTTVNAGTVDIAITGVTGWDPEVAIFSGACGAFVCESSADSGGTGTSETLTAVSVAAATQYWINIGHYSGSTNNSEGPFTIDISTADTTTLGIEDLQLSERFKFYPNPVNDVLNISAKNDIEKLQIVNMLGQTIKTVTPNNRDYQLDLSSLTSGIYFVKARVNNAEGTFRIVKK